MNRDDLPAVYRRAADTAKDHQKRYLWLVRGQVILPLVTAALMLFSTWVSPLAVVGASLVALAVIPAIAVGWFRPDRVWHLNRAIAEFGKSQAWRYMMAADPFAAQEGAADAEQALHEALNAEVEQWRETKALVAWLRTSDQVSDVMRRVRDLPFEQRLQIYLDDRVRDQLGYYQTNSAHSSAARDGWYTTMLVSQLLVAPVALLSAMHSWPFSVLGVVSSIPAAVSTWLRARRHEDLAPSYVVARQRLGNLLAQAGSVTTEKEFRFYVSSVEDLLTTEHAEWLSRRS